MGPGEQRTVFVVFAWVVGRVVDGCVRGCETALARVLGRVDGVGDGRNILNEMVSLDPNKREGEERGGMLCLPRYSRTERA